MVTQEDLLRLAEQRGLAVRQGNASGAVEGRRVSIDIPFLAAGEENVIVRAWLDAELDLGLEMRERVVASILGPGSMTGHPDLDSEFAVSADEADRVRALFAGPLRDELAALYRASFDLRLDDTGCSIYARTGFLLPDETWVNGALEAALKVASRMDEWRARVGPAHRLAPHAEVLQTLSTARGLAFTATPLVMRGAVEGRTLEILAVRTGRRRYYLKARASIEGDLAVGLALRRQGLLDGVRTLLGGQDVLLDDAPFDRRFLIQADPARADRLGVLLDAETRGALLAIDARCGPVSVDDHGISVEPIPLGRPPADLLWLADTLAEVTGRVSRNLVHGRAEAGPYR